MNVHLRDGKLSMCQHPLTTRKSINHSLHPLLFPKWDLNQSLLDSRVWAPRNTVSLMETFPEAILASSVDLGPSDMTWFLRVFGEWQPQILMCSQRQRRLATNLGQRNPGILNVGPPGKSESWGQSDGWVPVFLTRSPNTLLLGKISA